VRILTDTGVLLRFFERSAVDHAAVVKALEELWRNGHDLFTSAQNVVEFWNVSTRPLTARGGYGHAPADVDQRVKVIDATWNVLPFTVQAYTHWRRIVIDYQVTGVSVHDARIVATMLAESIQRILTLNGRDFIRYPGITVLSPQDVFIQ
jgi:predicted nucleic acid-binding protein